MKKIPGKFLVVALVALLANTPLYAVCAPDSCGIGPCVYSELLYDTSFDNNCPQWSWGGVAWRHCAGGECWAELWQTGDTVSQTVVIPAHSGPTEIAFDFSMNLNGSPLSERLIVEILHNGAVVDTVAILRASTAQPGFYSYEIDNWSNKTIKVRFRRAVNQFGGADGGTIFEVPTAYLWVYGPFS